MKQIFIPLLVLMLSTSCNSKKHKDSSSDLSLNNGSKWEVNIEMKPSINEAIDLVNQYLSNGDDDYKSLAEALEIKNSALVKSCTMEGKSHEELHKWLHPHIELVEELKESQNKDSAQQLVVRISDSFKKYNEYFQ